MHSSNQTLTLSSSRRLAGSLLAGFIVAAALVGASRDARAEIRSTPAYGCSLPLSTNLNTVYMGGPAQTTPAQQYGTAWRQFSWVSSQDNILFCPVNTANGFVPNMIYTDFSLFGYQNVSATIRRASYDGTTVEEKPLMSGNFSGGGHDVGASISFATISPWDYLTVIVQGVHQNQLNGIGYSN